MPRLKVFSYLTWTVALVLAAWVLSQLPLSGISRAVSSLSWTQWVVWSILNLVIILLLTARWHRLTKALGLQLDLLHLLLVRQAGQAISFLTPGPQFGGEPFQVYWLWNGYSVPGHAAVLAVGMDRFYELWINFAVLLIGVVLLLASPVVEYSHWRDLAVMLSAVVLALTSLGWMLSRQPGRIAAGIRRLAGRWQHHPRLGSLHLHLDRLGAAITEVVRRRKPELVTAVLLSLAGWAGMIAELWLLLSFFDLAVGFSGFILLLVAMRLAFLLPLPGGIGTLEAALFWAFQGLDLPAAAAVGVIALMRLRDAVVLLCGLLALRLLHARQGRVSPAACH